jgi:hypothetical protein
VPALRWMYLEERRGERADRELDRYGAEQLDGGPESAVTAQQPLN